MPYIAINSDASKPATFGKRSKPAAQYDREHQSELAWQKAASAAAAVPPPVPPKPKEKENRPPSQTPSLESAFSELSVDENGIAVHKRSQRRSLLPLDSQQRGSSSPRPPSRPIRHPSAHVQPQVGPLGSNAQRRLSAQSTVTMSSTSSRLSSYDPVRSMGVYVDPAAAYKSEIVNPPPMPSSPPDPPRAPPVLHTRASSLSHNRRVSAVSTMSTSTTATGSTNRAPGSRRSFLGLSTKASSSSISSSSRRSSTFQDIRRSIISFSSSSSSLFRMAQGPSEPQTSRPQPSMISLPTPSAVTREKMTNKMKTSQSLLSLGPDGTHAQNQEFARSQLATLMTLTSNNSIRPFEELVAQESVRVGPLTKIGEASYSEVFGAGDAVYKVVPFGSLDQTPVHELLQEIQISKLVMAHEGFVKLHGVYVVQGEYDQSLLDAWDAYASENVSENVRPSYQSDQMYCILVMDNAGEALETFRLRDAHEAFDIFKQTLWAIVCAEENLEFEHRDLHWGNVVIKKMSSGVKASIIDFTLSRARSASGESEQIHYTRLDHPDFFRGKGDYQFDIYRYMQRLLVERSPDQSLPDWSLFEPRSNVLWLHYLVVKLIDKLDQNHAAPKLKSDSVYYSRLRSLASTLDITNKRRFRPLKVRSAADVLMWGRKHRFW